MNFFQALLQASGVNLIFPFYHGVSDTPLPHIQHLYPLPTLQTFEQDLDFLLSYYKPLSLEEIIALRHGNSGHTGPGFHLSFDDGLSSCYDDLRPILLKKGVPATFFLNSGFVNNSALFYRYKASLLIHQMEKISLSPTAQTELAACLGLSRPTTTKLKRKILTLGYADSPQFEQLAHLLEIDFTTYLNKAKPYMELSQLQHLHQDGFTLGGHSIDHPYFSKISTKEQLRQSLESTQEIQQLFDLPYRVFAFPFTDYGLSKALFEQLYTSGIDLSFGTAGLKRDEFSRHIQRIPMETWPYSAKGVLHKAYGSYFPKALFRRNLVKHPD